MEEEDRKDRLQNRKSNRARESKRTIFLALTGMLAGVYTAGTVALGVVSFGVLNLRFTDILIGIVPIFGWAGVFGISLGVFISNTTSTLGPIDLLSALFSLGALTILHLLRKRSVAAGLAVYDAVLSLWVSFEISLESHLPYFSTFYLVFAGLTFVLVLAYFFYKALVLSGLEKKVRSVLG